MKTKRLGKTDLYLPVLGLGTVKIGRNEKVKYPEDFKIPDDEAVIELFNKAKSLGMNFIDTAPAYGSSESRLGSLLPGKREDWIIASKAGEEFIKGESAYDFSREHIIKSVKRSLKRLKTDYLDIVLIHSNGDDLNIINKDGALETLADLKKEGLIRASGMSTKTVDGGKRALELSDVVMVSYNPTDTECREVLEHAKDLNKGILIKKAFGSGHLCKDEKYTTEDIFKFIFHQAAVTSIVVGSINIKHLESNIIEANKAF